MSVCTAINCIDGRAQLPAIKFLTRKLGASSVDLVTEPGAVKVLAEQTDVAAIESIVRRVRASIHLRESRAIAVVAHEGCLANPVDQSKQFEHVLASIENLKQKFPETRMVGIWVDLRGKVIIVPGAIRDGNL